MSVDAIKDAIAASIEEVTGEEPIQEHDESGEPLGDDLPPIEDENAEPEPDADAEPAVVGDAEPEKKPAVEPEPAKKEKSAAEVDDFAKEHGVKAKDRHGRENKIPYTVVSGRIVPNAIKKAKTDWETKELAPAKGLIKTYEDRLTDVGKTEDIMFSNAGQFLGMLLKIPGYKEVLGDVKLNEHGHVIGVGAGGAKPADGARSVTANANDPEPLPDVKDDKGSPVGYSAEGLAKLRAWDREVAVKAALEAVGKEYKPVKDAFETHQGIRQRQQNVEQQLDAAYQWPGFKENVDEIYKVFTEEKLPLQAAYSKVIYGKSKGPDMAQIEKDLRAKFMAELKKAPRSTSTVGGGSSAAARTEAADAAAEANPVRAAIQASIRR